MAHKIEPVDGELKDLLHKSFVKKFSAWIKVDGVTQPKGYTKYAEAIEDFDVRNDDVWVCTFPKTGSTWTQEMVRCIVTDLDFGEADGAPLKNKFYMLDVCILLDDLATREESLDGKAPESELQSISYIEKLPSPRLIFTHLPFHLLPRQIRNGGKSPKIISVFRNAKDTCISYYHNSILMAGYQGSFEDFCKLFLADRVNYAPFYGHLLSFWQRRTQDNVFILKYEDMKKDLPSEIIRTAKFLGKELTSDQVSLLAEHLGFESMKKNPEVNWESILTFYRNVLNIEREGSFMRSGTTEQWKTVMSPELIEQFDVWTRRHSEGTDLPLL